MIKVKFWSYMPNLQYNLVEFLVLSWSHDDSDDYNQWTQLQNVLTSLFQLNV